jgi:hypothetical protein
VTIVANPLAQHRERLDITSAAFWTELIVLYVEPESRHVRDTGLDGCLDGRELRLDVSAPALKLDERLFFHPACQ